MAKNRITFFPCDNGDSSLIEAHGWTIMTDINYRKAAAEKDDDIPDFAPQIRKACNDDQLDIFVLTHPDKDHLGGFENIFHLGKPGDRDDDPKDDDVKLIVDEIWCSEYSANPEYADDSKPLLDEIARRKNLQGTGAGEEDGNRLKILTADEAELQSLCAGIDWRLLAPTTEEADIPVAAEGEPKNSSNPSSLVIQWTITVNGRESRVILAGDSTVEIWERLNRECEDDQLNWHILLTPHHCSRHTLGRTVVKDGEESFVWSDDAYSALDHPLGSKPHAVASSRKFGSDHPPHPLARDRYRKMLAKGGEITAEVKERFKCTAGGKGEDAEDIVFNFSSGGPTRAALVAAPAVSTPTSTGGGGYGQR